MYNARALGGDVCCLWVHGSHTQVWRDLPETFNAKSLRVGMSRWFAVHKGLCQLLPQWHSRALVTLYQVLQQGMTSGKAPAELLKIVPQALPQGGADMPGETTKQPGADLQKLRAATKNTLWLVATMLNDSQVHALAHVVAFCLQPIQEAHSNQRHRCRSLWVSPNIAGVVWAGMHSAVFSSLFMKKKTYSEPGGCRDG